ncbi:4525_t:CDS:2 [Paraglomus brasilianum]|uniref:ribose-phosphate diphosphokinase n=1 Tax=Paraglomus brasilianum TaxID=144538 RepID=A0A9N8VKH6_9GLOM|nr:4525_t:CDS:2 [Paraglomus brasilianum]
MRRAKIFAGTSHQELAHSICECVGIPPAPATLKRFSNKETSVEIGCSVRNEDVFIIQSGSTNVNDHLMELLIMIAACKGASAKRITAIMPYYPYSKQSKKKKARGAIAAKNHVITMDLHASQMQGFFNKPVDNLSAEPRIVQWIEDSVPDYANGVVVSKNAGGTRRVTSLADRLKIDFALIHTDYNRGPHRNSYDLPDSCISTDETERHQLMISQTLHSTHSDNASTSAVNNYDNGHDNAAVGGESASHSASASVIGEILTAADTETDRTTSLVGNVTGKVAFIVDDQIDKATSFIAAAEHLKKCDAKRIYVIATHGILSGDSIKNIENCSAIHKRPSEELIMEKALVFYSSEIILSCPQLICVVKQQYIQMRLVQPGAADMPVGKELISASSIKPFGLPGFLRTL